MQSYVKLKKILDNLQPYSIKLGLERIKALLKALSNPQNSFKSILIGGTNGKGSVAQMLNDSFLQKGYKTGLYTSPHLILLNERIKVNNAYVDFDLLLDLALQIEPLAREFDVTYFEFLTALSFLAFKKLKVEYAILEVGMGGEFDATNVVEPILSVLTSISFDHTEHLGKTIEEITKTKMAIIRKIGIIGKNSPNVINLIKQSSNADLYFVDEIYLSRAKQFDLNFLKCDYEKENLACAFLAIDCLNKYYNLGLDTQAIKNTYWPARFEIIKSANKTFIIDGAHNVDGANRFLECAKKIKGSKMLIYSSLKQKEYQKILNMLSFYFDEIIITKTNNRNSIDKDDIKFENKNYKFLEDANTSLLYAQQSNYENIFIAGSLYLAALAKACMLEENLP
ncbi:MAG: bifunctional folylpolyglutamate synthase/dihydrofolate synthase [Desulfurella sp.]|uniref:Dihydrofolate synthase/folylpolyglutamate synthase n=1 Tax=Desulfurella multipotens TaxID=79269 RepID=A0A1G6L9L1_9BACT|nr:Mur ligase family protein [Desulfurella multipotens]SDC39980.1 dihydrofolate synthase / folylpolyglutamate synthase [Desulfurella multipotens]